jgi:hypothetical protein
MTTAGVLVLANGGTSANLSASNGGIFYSTASAGAILAGTATANQVLLSGSSSAPAWSTATYPATTTINQILYSSSNNVITGLATANRGVLTTGSTGIPVITALATDGQVIIGSTAGVPAAATLTAGSNVSITNASNSITIAANTAAQVVNYTGVNHAASPYTVLSTDYYISCDVTAGVITVKLPNGPSTGRIFTVKDKVGLSATSNITVTTVGGAVNIDGATSYTISTNYAAINLIFNGTSYEVF